MVLNRQGIPSSNFLPFLNLPLCHHWGCLISFSSVISVHLNNVGRADLLAAKFLICLQWVHFISFSNTDEILAGSSILGWQFFCFRIWKMSHHSLLAWRVSTEKSAVSLMGVSLYVIWSFSSACFSIFSLCSEEGSLTMTGLGEAFFRSNLFGIHYAFCIWLTFPMFRKFSFMISLNAPCNPASFHFQEPL